jgi:hypothetical protein
MLFCVSSKGEISLYHCWSYIGAALEAPVTADKAAEFCGDLNDSRLRLLLPYTSFARTIR